MVPAIPVGICSCHTMLTLEGTLQNQHDILEVYPYIVPLPILILQGNNKCNWRDYPHPQRDSESLRQVWNGKKDFVKTGRFGFAEDKQWLPKSFLFSRIKPLSSPECPTTGHIWQTHIFEEKRMWYLNEITCYHNCFLQSKTWNIFILISLNKE